MSSIKNILPTNGLTALALSYAGTSETISPFVLPWNYKNTRIRSNPYYLQNELDTLTVRISQSAKAFKSNVALRVFAQAAPPTPFTSRTVNALPTQGVNALSANTTSSKTLLGLNCNGVQYDALTLAEIVDPYFVGNFNPGDLLFEYNVTGQILQISEPALGPSVQVLSVDLSVTPGYYNLDIANLCNSNTHATLNNVILNFAGVSFSPVALNPAAPLTNTAEYLITGNRIWFFIKTASPLSGSATFQIAFKMIERQLPVTIPGLIPALLVPTQCQC